MERNINITGDLILPCNFNIHINNSQSPDTINFNDFLDSFGPTNKVTFPTHCLQNTLDLIIVEEESIKVQHLRQGSLFSDHHMVHFNLITKLPLPTKAKITYIKLTNINTTTFGYDITNALANQDIKGMSLEENNALYNNLLQRTLDTHAPNHQKVIIRNKTPCFSHNIRDKYNYNAN